jgi:antibiotic biosynthesis monooxygenase (ABM) superfamily enzyme
MERAAPHVAGPMRTGTEFLTGLESWFTLPTQPGTSPPPPYKMAVLTWVTIFRLITLVIVVSAPLIRSLPLIPKLAVTTLVTVALMTWVVMRRVTRLLRGWLYPGRRR